jgi:hypothetical protein
MKTWGSGCIDPHLLYLSTSWRCEVSFAPLLLYPWGRTPGTHSVGGWVGPRTGLDDVEKRKFFTLLGLELWPLCRPASLPFDILAHQVTVELSLIQALCSCLQHVLSLLSLMCLHHLLPGNSFQWWMFPLLWVPELSPCLSYQFLTAAAHSDWTAFLWLSH